MWKDAKHGQYRVGQSRVDYLANCQTQYNKKHDLAEDIRQIVNQHLGNVRGKVRHAAYYGPCLSHHADLENILFYNTGVWGLGQVTWCNPCLRLECSRQRPVNGPPEDKSTHCYSYWLEEETEPGPFALLTPSIKLPAVRFSNPEALANAKIVWYKVKDALNQSQAVDAIHNDLEPTEQLGFRVTMSIYRPSTRKQVYLLKPIFDGIAAALHWWNEGDATIRDKLEKCKSKFGDVEVNRLTLTRNVRCLLGLKAILDRRTKPAPQLNPDDHRIAAGELTLSENHSNSTVLDVSIYRLPAVAKCSGAQ